MADFNVWSYLAKLRVQGKVKYEGKIYVSTSRPPTLRLTSQCIKGGGLMGRVTFFYLGHLGLR